MDIRFLMANIISCEALMVKYNRVCLIIDGGYLNALRPEIGNLDIISLKNFIEASIGPITCAYFVTSVKKENEYAAERFHAWISSLSWMKLIRKGQKDKRCHECGNNMSVEKGVDVAISTLAIRGAVEDSYDILLLINGDGDLIDAMSYVRELGKEFMLMTERTSTSMEMFHLASKFLNIYSVAHQLTRGF